MKKILLVLFISILLAGCEKEKVFYLNDEYYGDSSLIEIDSREFKVLERDKKSFIVFVYMPLCTTSYDFNAVLTEFIDIYKVGFYKIPFRDIKDTSMGSYIKYFPSVVIYRDGKVVSYLDANKDEDLHYYESANSFKEWLTKYVILNND